MATRTYPLLPKASVSLSVEARRGRDVRPMMSARAAGFVPSDADRLEPSRRAAVLVEARDTDAVTEALGDGTDVHRLSETFLSVQGDVAAVAALTEIPQVRRVQTKKVSQPHLDAVLPDIGLAAPAAGSRPVVEDGSGVLVGIVDSGFDLSHPMFRDAAGKLRVEALLDQTVGGGREFTNTVLERRWAGGNGPGADQNGHGTHVTSIAAGSRFGALEGVAPGARLLLVKTNFRDTDRAVSWIFQKAAHRPCVVNMSLGHHFGAHDGTDAEERLHVELSGPGRVIVVSAGNERNDDMHLGGRFHAGQVEELAFDLLRQPDGTAFVVVTVWHSRDDRFDIALVTPEGDLLAEPALGNAVEHDFSTAGIAMAQQRYVPSNLVQHQISVEVRGRSTSAALRGWRLRATCRRAAVGRLDGWFHNSGFAAFGPHPLLEPARTVGITATGSSCLAVASHITKAAWDSDSGPRQNVQLVLGRSSQFSSLGPTRDGRQKPDVSAPGQMVTAALAHDSEEAADDRFALTADRLLTIAGTSMAAPAVTGAVALLLQQKPDRTVEAVRQILGSSVRRDAHTGPGPWDPTYGLGKLDIAKALHGP
jgi:subtilisin family serine protease